MPQALNPIQIKDKQQKIAALYYEYLIKLHQLSQEQQQIIETYVKELESQKITNLKNKLNS